MKKWNPLHHFQQRIVVMTQKGSLLDIKQKAIAHHFDQGVAAATRRDQGTVHICIAEHINATKRQWVRTKGNFTARKQAGLGGVIHRWRHRNRIRDERLLRIAPESYGRVARLNPIPLTFFAQNQAIIGQKPVATDRKTRCKR
ncbi:MAG: hypothetical protein IPF39_12970 [Comamonadaceae bacterium]|uniref:hypothetical protein n=1 Tax=Candidatus Skiveiella danica TaxID=3386177 RepID=UPI00390B0976|nr:hypothetical protein [Comamonadaceae bacterium]